MRYEDVSSTIPGTATGVYIAYPTTAESRPTYRGYKTRVNLDHTKVGITKSNFTARQNQYEQTFHHEVAFFRILQLPEDALATFEKMLLKELLARYTKSGNAREWFRTTERQAIAELVWRLGKRPVDDPKPHR